MIIKTSNFVISSSDVNGCPQSNLPEYAFIGRSNVGKSSLINMLTGRLSLAKVSGTPGKTQLINHFIINNEWHLVDLPGYGFAKVAKTVKDKFQKLITDYVSKREQLVNMFVLVDIRHEPQKIDLEFMQYLGENGMPFAIVFTKADKLKPTEITHHVQQYKKALLEDWEELPIHFVTSSAKKMGQTEILDYIEEINKTLESDKKSQQPAQKWNPTKN